MGVCIYTILYREARLALTLRALHLCLFYTFEPPVDYSRCTQPNRISWAINIRLDMHNLHDITQRQTSGYIAWVLRVIHFFYALHVRQSSHNLFIISHEIMFVMCYRVVLSILLLLVLAVLHGDK